MNEDLIKQYALSGVRFALLLFGGTAIAKVSAILGVPAGETTTMVTNGAVWVIVFVWSLMNKTRAETKLNTALSTPSGTSKTTLKEIIANGEGVSATAKL